jgi:hypothetical protein
MPAPLERIRIKSRIDRIALQRGVIRRIMIFVIEVDGKSVALTCRDAGEAAILKFMLENPVILGKHDR